MLDRYVKNEKKRRVPFCLDNLSITVHGVLTDEDQQKRILFDDDNCVTVRIIDGLRRVTKSFLIAITFKPVFNSSTFILNWTVLHIDGDLTNCHPSNLTWKPPLGGQPCPEDDSYFVVPGYSRHGVTEDGIFYNRYTKKILKSRRSGKYLNVSAYLDNGEYSVLGVHRAMGLALLEYSADVNEMTVNHIDGVKYHNYLSNLEWATYSENNLHALDMGLRMGRKACELRDYNEGVNYSFESITAAAAFINTTAAAMISAKTSNRHGLYAHRYAFRYLAEDNNFPELSQQELDLLLEKQKDKEDNKDCLAYNIASHQTTIASSPGELAKAVGFTKDEMWTAIESSSPWPSKGFICFFLNKPKKIPSFTPEEKIAFVQETGIRNPVELIAEDGYRTVYPSIKKLCPLLGLQESYLRYKLARTGIFESPDYTVKRLKPTYS